MRSLPVGLPGVLGEGHRSGACSQRRVSSRRDLTEGRVGPRNWPRNCSRVSREPAVSGYWLSQGRQSESGHSNAPIEARVESSLNAPRNEYDYQAGWPPSAEGGFPHVSRARGEGLASNAQTMKKKAAERVETERLILRRPTVHDACRGLRALCQRRRGQPVPGLAAASVSRHDAGIPRIQRRRMESLACRPVPDRVT
jgi:hypothetical protein